MLCSAGIVAGASVLADLLSDVLTVSTDDVLAFTSETDYAAASDAGLGPAPRW